MNAITMGNIPDRPTEPHDPTSRFDPPEPTEADRECAREQIALTKLECRLAAHMGATDGREVVSDALCDLGSEQLRFVADHVSLIADPQDEKHAEWLRARIGQLIAEQVMRYAKKLPAPEVVERQAEILRDDRLNAARPRFTPSPAIFDDDAWHEGNHKYELLHEK